MKSKSTGRQKCYRRRDRNLKKIGFSDYNAYLNSDIWREIRLEVLRKRKFVCRFCGGRATQVHHLRYTQNVLLKLNKHYIGGLVAICSDCHCTISKFAKENKIHEQTAFDEWMKAKKVVKEKQTYSNRTFLLSYKALS